MAKLQHAEKAAEIISRGTTSFIFTEKKGFVIPTKQFVKIGITKYFVTTNCLVLSTKRLVAAAKFLVAATKKLFVVSNFVAVTKPFFSVLLSTLKTFLVDSYVANKNQQLLLAQ